jgi:NADH dehydrogenase/NADH:ubiquinone oxidoreductase subunit G
VHALVAPKKPQTFAALCAAVQSKAITHVLALGSDVEDPAAAKVLSSLAGLIALSTWQGPLAAAAQVVLPASSWVESDGQYMNAKGLVQEGEQIIEPKGQSRPAWKLSVALGVRLGVPIPWRNLEELRAALSGATTAAAKAKRSLQPGAVQ